MHKAVNMTIHAIIVLCVLMLAKSQAELGKEVRVLEEGNVQLIETIGVLSELASTNTNNMVDIADALNGLPENEEFIRVIVQRVVKKLPPIVVETESDLESAIEAAVEAIAEVSAAVDELEGEPLTFEQIEALVDASIAEDNVEEDKYNTLVAETITNIELHQQILALKDDLNKQANKPNTGKEVSVEEFKEAIKLEVYQTFAKAGYGKIVDGKFIPRQPFFGAEILEGEEHRYEPVSPFK